jgi:hypothetical protein
VQPAASGIVGDVMAVVLPGGFAVCGMPGTGLPELGVEEMAVGFGRAEHAVTASPAAARMGAHRAVRPVTVGR